jgi:molecular chaperone GrpE
MTQKKKPAEAQRQAKEYLADLQRLKAEFDNYKKRTEKERMASANRASLDLIRRLIPVMDDLDRAVGAAAQDEAAARFTEGLELVRLHFNKALAEEGVTEIDAYGQLFDPNLHEAILQEPSEEHADEHVTEVLRKGYALGDLVIRPAMVKIAKNDG